MYVERSNIDPQEIVQHAADALARLTNSVLSGVVTDDSSMLDCLGTWSLIE